MVTLLVWLEQFLTLVGARQEDFQILALLQVEEVPLSLQEQVQEV